MVFFFRFCIVTQSLDGFMDCGFLVCRVGLGDTHRTGKDIWLTFGALDRGP